MGPGVARIGDLCSSQCKQILSTSEEGQLLHIQVKGEGIGYLGEEFTDLFPSWLGTPYPLPLPLPDWESANAGVILVSG